jgi:hypothetical protein
MTPPKKPEWFELTESDGVKPRPVLKSGFRTLALSIPLLAIGVGVVAAQTSNESPASVETATVAIASAAPSVTQSVTPALTSAVVQPKASIGTPPLPPTGGDDDDDDVDNERDERNHDDDDDEEDD